METIQKSIDVGIPVATVYHLWTEYEEFPKFMQGVREVHQISPRRLYWKAEIFGKEKEWEAEVYENIPNQRISWRSTAGAPNTGSVNFEELESDRTRIRLAVGFEPESALEKIGDLLGMVGARIQGDLERFKSHAEAHGGEVGGGRGHGVHGGHGRIKTY